MKEWKYAVLVPAGNGNSWSLNQKSGSYLIEIEIELSDALEDVGSEWKQVDQGVYRVEVGKITWNGLDDYAEVINQIEETLATGLNSIETLLGQAIVIRAELIEQGVKPESLYTKTNFLDLVNAAGEDGWELNIEIEIPNEEMGINWKKRLLMRREIT